MLAAGWQNDVPGPPPGVAALVSRRPIDDVVLVARAAVGNLGGEGRPRPMGVQTLAGSASWLKVLDALPVVLRTESVSRIRSLLLQWEITWNIVCDPIVHEKLGKQHARLVCEYVRTHARAMEIGELLCVARDLFGGESADDGRSDAADNAIAFAQLELTHRLHEGALDDTENGTLAFAWLFERDPKIDQLVLRDVVHCTRKYRDFVRDRLRALLALRDARRLRVDFSGLMAETTTDADARLLEAVVQWTYLGEIVLRNCRLGGYGAVLVALAIGKTTVANVHLRSCVFTVTDIVRIASACLKAPRAIVLDVSDWRVDHCAMLDAVSILPVLPKTGGGEREGEWQFDSERNGLTLRVSQPHAAAPLAAL